MRDDPVLNLVLRRLRWSIVAFLSLVLAATTAYMVLEGFGWVDALYMTVITLGTIGFQEVQPLDTSGRFLTIMVITLGFTVILYTAAVTSDLFASGDLSSAIKRRRRRQVRARLQGHMIVVGYGRVGRAVTQELVTQGQDVVVVDTDEDLMEIIEEAGATFVLGDGTHDDDLEKAGVHRAAALCASAKDDPTNLVVVLTARSLNADLRIVSRVGFPEWTSRIRRAGANRTISPYETAGRSLAASAVLPDVLGLQDLPELGLRSEEIEVLAGSPVISEELAGLAHRHSQLVFLAVRRGEVMHSRSDVAGPLRIGDVLVALGPPDELSSLAEAACPPPARN